MQLETMMAQSAASLVISLLSCSSSAASQQGARFEPHIHASSIGLCSDIGMIKDRGSGRNFDFCYRKMKANFLQRFARI
jgi:hypothetical protein